MAAMIFTGSTALGVCRAAALPHDQLLDVTIKGLLPGQTIEVELSEMMPPRIPTGRLPAPRASEEAEARTCEWQNLFRQELKGSL